MPTAEWVVAAHRLPWWQKESSAELPSLATLIAQTKGRHRFVSGSCLHLVVGDVGLTTLGTLDQVSGGASCHRHLMLLNHFLRNLLT